MAFSERVNDILARVSRETGVDLAMLRAFCWIESSGRPHLVSPSGYKGLFQLSAAEFKKHGGHGSIFDPYQNALAGAKKLKHDIDVLDKRWGRKPNGAELYLMHQQGLGGSTAHRTHPQRLAWQSMHSTAEGRKRGAAWSKKAIWGNLTATAKHKFGSVEKVTSADFMTFWSQRYDHALEQTQLTA